MADILNIDDARSYVTEANLRVQLKKRGLDAASFMVVCNRRGRFTAIFTLGQLQVANISMTAVVHAGFPVVN